MPLLLTILIFVTCILLILVVLVQNPKGGGLSSAFGGGGQQMFGGVKKTTDFLDRSTWTLSIILLALVIGSNLLLTPNDAALEGDNAPESAIGEQIEGFSMPPVQQNAVPVNASEDMSEGLPESIEEEE